MRILAIWILAMLAIADPAHADDKTPADCPDESTLLGRMRIADGEPSCEQVAKNAMPHRSITPAEQRRIIAHFDTILVDGPSARWRWEKVIQGSLACFWVNSKNRMGGYSGWSRYTFDLKTGKASSLDELNELLARLNMPEASKDICL